MQKLSRTAAFSPSLIAQRFDDGSAWVGGDLIKRSPSEMTDEHLDSLKLWLTEHACHYCAVMASVQHPGSIPDRSWRRGVMDSALGRKMIRETALWKNVVKEQQRRHDLKTVGQAIDPIPVEVTALSRGRTRVTVAGVKIVTERDGSVASVEVLG